MPPLSNHLAGTEHSCNCYSAHIALELGNRDFCWHPSLLDLSWAALANSFCKCLSWDLGWTVAGRSVNTRTFLNTTLWPVAKALRRCNH